MWGCGQLEVGVVISYQPFKSVLLKSWPIEPLQRIFSLLLINEHMNIYFYFVDEAKEFRKNISISLLHSCNCSRDGRKNNIELCNT